MHFFPLIWRKSYIFVLAWSYTLILLEELAPSELTIFTGFHTETEKAFSSGQPHVWTCNKCREVIQSLEEQEGSLRQDLKISVQSSWSMWSKCVRSVKITQPQQENPPGKRLTRGRIIQQWEEGGPQLRTDTSRSYKVSLECQIYFKVRNQLGNPSYLSLVNKSTRVRSWYIEYSMYIAPASRCSSEHPNNCESSFDSYWAVINSGLYEWSKQKINLDCTSQRTGYSVFFEGRTPLGDGLNIHCRESSSSKMEWGLQPFLSEDSNREILLKDTQKKAMFPVEERSKNNEATTTLAHWRYFFIRQCIGPFKKIWKKEKIQVKRKKSILKI